MEPSTSLFILLQHHFSSQFVISRALLTLFLILTVFIIRIIVVHFIKGDAEVLTNEQRRWTASIKNISLITILLTMFLIWAPQLHTFALSLTAIAVAIVVAFKEVILCLTGAMLRLSTAPFKVGDWVTIEGISGEVTDADIFAFQIQEIDTEKRTYHYSGRTIKIPNSKLFTSNLENLNFLKKYAVYDSITIVPHAGQNPKQLLDKLAEITEKHFAPYRAEAVSFHKKIKKKSTVDMPDPEPIVMLKTTDIGNYSFTFRIFVPTLDAAKIASKINTEFLDEASQIAKSYDLARKSAQ